MTASPLAPVDYDDHARRSRMVACSSELATVVGMATGADVVDGRFIIETRHRKVDWEVIVEPDEVAHSLVVITAYAVDL